MTNLDGEKFNRWTVLGYNAENTSYRVCQCDCGNVGSVYISKLTSGYSKSCGCQRSDSARNNSNNLIGQKFGRLKVIEKTDKRIGRKIVWRCICDCGNIIEAPTTYLTTGDTKSCGCYKTDNSRKMMIEVSKNNIGPRNHNWKGGISNENQKIRSGGKYSSWRKMIFTRDGYSCQVCGIKNTYLNAHHIYSFSKYPHMRLEIDNGISMCLQCHKEFHNLFGKKHFGEIELMDFIDRKATK